MAFLKGGRLTGVDHPGVGVQEVERDEDVLEDQLQEIDGEALAGEQLPEAPQGDRQRLVDDGLVLVLLAGDIELIEHPANERRAHVACFDGVQVPRDRELARECTVGTYLHGHVPVLPVAVERMLAGAWAGDVQQIPAEPYGGGAPVPELADDLVLRLEDLADAHGVERLRAVPFPGLLLD